MVLDRHGDDRKLLRLLGHGNNDRIADPDARLAYRDDPKRARLMTVAGLVG